MTFSEFVDGARLAGRAEGDNVSAKIITSRIQRGKLEIVTPLHE
jgi:hypothetical protein